MTPTAGGVTESSGVVGGEHLCDVVFMDQGREN